MNALKKALAVAIFTLPLPALGQQQVDPGGVGQVDNRVNGELYGKNSGMGMLLLPPVRLLPSEERYAIWRSGALPSEVEAGRIANGPLSPNGVLDYLPRQSPLQRAMGLRSPQLYNPAYDAMLRRDARVGGQPQAAGFGPQRGYPQTLREGLMATRRIAGQQPQQQQVAQGRQVTRQAEEQAVPGLTPAPDQPLPTGQLFDEVRYEPNSTVGARFLNRQLPKIVPPTPTKRPASLADEQQGPPAPPPPQQQ